MTAHGIDHRRRQRLLGPDRGLHARPHEQIRLQRLADPVDDRVAEAADHHGYRHHHRETHRKRGD
jgi:hypothetical protein